VQGQLAEVKAPKSAREFLADIKVVDADTHISEWDDLWTSRATPKFADRVPRVKRVDGARKWIIDHDAILAPEGGFSAILKDGSKVVGTGFRNRTLPEIHAGAYNVHERVKYMDREGVWAQIAYTNLLGFGGQKAMMVDPELRLVSTIILNDAMAEMQADSGNRVFPMAMMPWWDVKLAAAEAERCADMGMRGINMNSDPHIHGVPHLGDPYWNPLWDVCVDRNLPVNFHIGASDESMTWHGAGLWPGHPDNIALAYGSLMLFVGNMRVLANILLSRFLERYPTLKIVSVESGAGWIPFMLEGLDYQMLEAGVKLEESMSDIFRRQIYACSWFERKHIVSTMRQLGAENLMFETDFPHPTCLYPDPLDYMTSSLGEMTVDERQKVFGGNAQKVYGLDFSAKK
jgi:predicted TIM-barrel fold metal-dependent hydrolase